MVDGISLCSFTKSKGHRVLLREQVERCLEMPFGGLIHILNLQLFLIFVSLPTFLLCCLNVQKKVIVSSFFYFRFFFSHGEDSNSLRLLCQLFYKADTLTIFPPEYSGDSGLSSPSGVVTGGVGMLIIAVVT